MDALAWIVPEYVPATAFDGTVTVTVQERVVLVFAGKLSEVGFTETQLAGSRNWLGPVPVTISEAVKALFPAGDVTC
jgi:hypothetical protein